MRCIQQPEPVACVQPAAAALLSVPLGCAFHSAPLPPAALAAAAAHAPCLHLPTHPPTHQHHVPLPVQQRRVAPRCRAAARVRPSPSPLHFPLSPISSLFVASCTNAPTLSTACSPLIRSHFGLFTPSAVLLHLISTHTFLAQATPAAVKHQAGSPSDLACCPQLPLQRDFPGTPLPVHARQLRCFRFRLVLSCLHVECDFGSAKGGKWCRTGREAMQQQAALKQAEAVALRERQCCLVGSRCGAYAILGGAWVAGREDE